MQTLERLAEVGGFLSSVVLAIALLGKDNPSSQPHDMTWVVLGRRILASLNARQFVGGSDHNEITSNLA